MNKTKLFVGALMGAMLCSTCLTSCVKDDESESVTAVRAAKATLLLMKAQAEQANAAANTTYQNAQAELLKGQAAYQNALAEYEKAQAAYTNAQTAELQEQTAYEKANWAIQLQTAQSNYEKLAAANLAAQRQAELTLAQAVNDLKLYTDTTTNANIREYLSQYINELNTLSALRENVAKQNRLLQEATVDKENWAAYKDILLQDTKDSINIINARIKFAEANKNMSKEAMRDTLTKLGNDSVTAHLAYIAAKETATQKLNTRDHLAKKNDISGSHKDSLLAITWAYKQVGVSTVASGDEWKKIKVNTTTNYVYNGSKKLTASYTTYSINPSDTALFANSWANYLKNTLQKDTANANKKANTLKKTVDSLYTAYKGSKKDTVRLNTSWGYVWDAKNKITVNGSQISRKNNKKADGSYYSPDSILRKDSLYIEYYRTQVAYETALSTKKSKDSILAAEIAERNLAVAYVKTIMTGGVADFNAWVKDYTAAAVDYDNAQTAENNAYITYQTIACKARDLEKVYNGRESFVKVIADLYTTLTRLNKVYVDLDAKLTSYEATVAKYQDILTEYQALVTAWETRAKNTKALLDALEK